MNEPYTLHLSPTASTRDRTNGRYLPGHPAFNKGRPWSEWMPKRAQKRCAQGWKNLERWRNKNGRAEGCGKPKHPVIAITPSGWHYFPSTAHAARAVGGHDANIRRCCRQNALHADNTDHQYLGIRFYYEDDEIWMKKI